jgi:hypothetical protein
MDGSNSIEQTNVEGFFIYLHPRYYSIEARQSQTKPFCKACHQNADYLLLLTARLPCPFLGGPLP